MLTPVRSLYGLAGTEAFALAGRATQLLDWQRNHRFCGRCATPTKTKTNEFAMECPACGLLAYPRISPAVMVLIRRGEELLLARSPHFKPGVFSALAGFVEAGETLEQCAVREVREEVGVDADNAGTIVECRERGFALLESRPDFLEPRVFDGSYGEQWSVRKVLRRFIWHDRIHAKAMYRQAVKTFGAEKIVDSFGF